MTLLHRAQKQGRKFLNPVPTTVGGVSMMFKVLPLFLTNRKARSPRIPPGPFRTDPSLYSNVPSSGLRITWMGHSSMLLELDGVRILIDPVWDQRASPFSWMGPERFFAPPLQLEELPELDAVLVSHDHYDHLGERTIRELACLPCAAKASWITSLGVGAILERFGVQRERIVELDWTETAEVAAKDGSRCEILSMPARHFSGRSLSNRFETLWASFVLRGARHTVYFGADSGEWEGFAEIGAAYGPFDLTMLEIGAFNELWKAIHLGPDGAAAAFHALGGSGLLMPIHWGLFDLALHAWQQPMERMVELAEAQRLKLWSPEPGRPTEVIQGEEVRSDWWIGR